MVAWYSLYRRRHALSNRHGSQSTAVLSRPFRVDDDIGRYEAGECNDEDDTWEEFWLHLNWQTDSECWGNMTSADFGELLEHRIEWL